MIRQTVGPWPKSKLYNPYHFHPATGWDKATQTYIDSRTQRSFMDFAPEIRNIIYHALLVMPNPVRVNRGIAAYARDVQQGWQSRGIQCIIHQTDIMGLSVSCKTIYYETVPLYFGQNTFAMDSYGLKRFSDQLGPESRRHITKLSVAWTGPALGRAAKSLRTFTGLLELKLDSVSLYTFKKSTGQNLQVKFYGLKDLLCLRGLDVLEVQCRSLVQNVDSATVCTKEQDDALRRSLEVLFEPRVVASIRATRKVSPGSEMET